jgi:hypothetical protein
MSMIYVRARPGRRVYTQEGRVIPSDNFISVPYDSRMRRIVEHWGDVDVQEGKDKATPVPSQPPKPQAETKPMAHAANVKEPSGNPAPGTGAPKPQN